MSSTTLVSLATQVDYPLPSPPKSTGTAIGGEGDVLPKVFQPLTIKGKTFANRVGVSPMCMYSSDKGGATPFHYIHYGAFATRGAFTLVEATLVSPEGGLSPQDLGIWNDELASKLKPVVDFAHAEKQLIGIQIGHGGRKASGQPLYIHLEQIADESVGGWPTKTVAPLAIPFREYGNYPTPQELTKDGIRRIIDDFEKAAYRAVHIAGFDAIQIHGAHGYLINEFMSLTSNHRTDEYGGSFENRIRFALEVIEAVKRGVGSKLAQTPIWFRISALENSPVEGAWTIEDSIKFAEIVADKIDAIDISLGGNNSVQNRRTGLGDSKYPVHVPLAIAIKKAVGDKLIVSTVGGLNDGKAINGYLEEGLFDYAFVGKKFLENPGLVLQWADDLGVKLQLAPEYSWAKYLPIQDIIELMQKTEELKLEHEKTKTK